MTEVAYLECLAAQEAAYWEARRQGMGLNDRQIGDLLRAVAPPLRECWQVLDYDHIPIERSWAVSMLLHEELGHEGSWETCEEGCDQLGDRVIRALFGR